MTRINRKGINKHMSYSIKELTSILQINEKTILRWIDTGLPTVPGCKKPLLIMGYDLTTFLKRKDSKKRTRLKRNQFYCLTCKAARYAKRGSIQTLADRKVAFCRVCSGKMSRTIKPYQKGLFDIPTQHLNVRY